MILDGWTIYGNTHHLELVPEARYWSCERQILEPLVTATGATNDSPCQSIAILELRATDTGAASDRYWSRERQILELRATDTGAACDSHQSHDSPCSSRLRRAATGGQIRAAHDRYWSPAGATDTGAYDEH